MCEHDSDVNNPQVLIWYKTQPSTTYPLMTFYNIFFRQNNEQLNIIFKGNTYLSYLVTMTIHDILFLQRFVSGCCCSGNKDSFFIRIRD